jgi:hypothetical protein
MFGKAIIIALNIIRIIRINVKNQQDDDYNESSTDEYINLKFKDVMNECEVYS